MNNKIAFIIGLTLVLMGISQTFAESTRTIIASSETTGKKCGDNCYWAIYSDGTLDITGSGAMYDSTAVYNTESYCPDPAWPYITTMPWGNYLHDFSKVNIGDNITSIGNRNFYGLNLSEINFGENSKLKKIDETAFWGTVAPANIIIPDKLNTTGIPGAQKYCTASQVANSVCGTNALIYEKKGNLYFISDQEGNLKQVYEGYDNFSNNVKKQESERSYFESDNNGNITLFDNNGSIIGKYSSSGAIISKYFYNDDGSIGIYDANGKLTGLKNAKHITPIEAAELAKDGKNNTVTLTFK